MKVTDEMVDAAFEETPQGQLYREDVRAMLEAALADVPEPGTGGLSGPEALRLRIASERYKTRAEDAEAKLAKVREWRSSFNEGDRPDALALDAILDGEDK
jgi:hypothetical protein